MHMHVVIYARVWLHARAYVNARPQASLHKSLSKRVSVCCCAHVLVRVLHVGLHVRNSIGLFLLEDHQIETYTHMTKKNAHRAHKKK